MRGLLRLALGVAMWCALGCAGQSSDQPPAPRAPSQEEPAPAPAVEAEAAVESRIIRNGMGQVRFLLFSPDGGELVRICRFGGVQLFDTADRERMRTFRIGMRAIAYSPDGARIATAEGTDGARVWDAVAPGLPMRFSPGAGPHPGIRVVEVFRKPLAVLQGPVHGRNARDVPGRVFCVEFAPDGSRALTTHADGHTKVWDTTNWAVEQDLAPTRDEVRAAAFSPDGKTVVIGDARGGLFEWDLERRTEVWRGDSSGAVMQIAFAPSGGGFVTVQITSAAAADSSVVFWSADREQVERRPGFGAAAFSPDGRLLAVGGSRVELLDPATRAPTRILELHRLTTREANAAVAAEMGDDADAAEPVAVTALAFGLGGRTLAAGCADGTVRIIDLQP